MAGYKLPIDVVDRASARIDAINKRIQALRAPVEALNRSTSRFSQLSGISGTFQGLTSGFGALSSSARGALGALGAMSPAMGALTGGAVVAGVATLATQYARMGTTLDENAYLLRMNVQNLDAWRGAARKAGVDADQMTGAMLAADEALKEASRNPGTDVAKDLLNLGVRGTDAWNNPRKVEDVLPEVLEVIKRRNINPQATKALLDRLTGGNGLALLPFARDHDISVETRKEMSRSGWTKADIDMAKQATYTLGELRNNSERLQNSLSAALVPSISRVTGWLNTWMQRNQGVIRSGLEGYLGGLPDRLEKYSRALSPVTSTIDGVIQSTTGWNTAIDIGVGLLAAKTLGVTRLLGKLAELALWRMPAGLAALLGIPVGAAAGIAGTVAGLGGLLLHYAPGGIAHGGTPRGPVNNDLGLPGIAPTEGPRMSPHTDRNGLLRGASRQGAQHTVESLPAPRNMLDMIGRAEGTDVPGRRNYNETLRYGHYTGGNVNLTGMTLNEVDALQTRMLRHPDNHQNSSAVGRYQIVRETLRGLRQDLGLRGDERYDEAMQDRLASALMERRGLRAYQAGRITAAEFQERLALEWASIPRPSTGQGAYPGQRDPGVPQATIDNVLRRARTDLPQRPTPPAPQAPTQQAPTPQSPEPAQAAPAPGPQASLDPWSINRPRAQTINGNIQVAITGNNMPGTRIAAQSTGAAFNGAPLVRQPTPTGGFG